MYSPVRPPSSPTSRILRKQQGSQPLIHFLPSYKKLEAFETMSREDSTIKFGLEAVLEIICGFFGQVTHSDKAINEYLQANLLFLEWDKQTTFIELYKNYMRSTLWAGFAVAENIFVLDKETGLPYLEDVVTYHPNSIQIKPNRAGRMVDGDDAWDGTRSGIYQQTYQGQKQLPVWKCVWMAHGAEFGNFYGRSFLEAAYRWYLIEGMVSDLMVDALERFGTPLTAIKFADGQTQEKYIDPNTNMERTYSTREVLEMQVQEVQLNGRSIFFLPYTDEKMKPELQVLTTGNNVGTTFLDVIQFCDSRKLSAFLMPFSLLNHAGDYNNVSVERQVELFYRSLKSLGERTMRMFVAQTLHRLIKLSYPGKASKEPPRVAVKDPIRPEDRVSLMQMVTGLTNTAYLNPNNEQDWNTVRDWVGLVSRQKDKADDKFIKDILINKGGPGQNPRPGRPTGTARPQDEPREANSG